MEIQDVTKYMPSMVLGLVMKGDDGQSEINQFKGQVLHLRTLTMWSVNTQNSTSQNLIRMENSVLVGMRVPVSSNDFRNEGWIKLNWLWRILPVDEKIINEVGVCQKINHLRPEIKDGDLSSTATFQWNILHDRFHPTQTKLRGGLCNECLTWGGWGG